MILWQCTRDAGRLPVLRLCMVKDHVLAPAIVIDITFYWFEVEQKLVRSNYFAHDGQRALTFLTIF